MVERTTSSPTPAATPPGKASTMRMTWIERLRALKQRQGNIMVLVAAGMIALLTFSAFAIDVGFMYLNRAQLEAMSMAGARAGYEALRKVNFQYATNQTFVDDTIRQYLEENGATPAEAAAASITVERRGSIRVVTDRNAPTFFWRVQGIQAVAVAGLGQIIANNLAPFAIPTTYQDQNQDGYSNWNIADETIQTAPALPWAYKVNFPYIVKFGRDSGQPGSDNDWVFIPMDDNAHTITVGTSNSPFDLPAQTTGSTSSSLIHGSKNYNGDKAARAALTRTNIGLLRAYGIAYDAAGVTGTAQKGVYWVLGYDGGSFLIARETLQAIGYDVGTESPLANNSFEAYITRGGVSTNVKCVNLRSQGSFRPLDVDFLRKLDALTGTGKINLLKIPKQPKIATFTENNDPVTQTMMNAGIPFSAFFLNVPTTGFHTFSFTAANTKAQIQAMLDNPANGGPFEWLHLHHEDFAQASDNSGTTPYNLMNFVDFLDDWVRVHHKFIFAACWATETLELALAKLSSPNWTADGGVPTAHMDHYGLTAGDKLIKEIKYDKTFAFQDFFVGKNHYDGAPVETPGGDDSAVYRMGNVPLYGISDGCPGNCFSPESMSEIDNEDGSPDVHYADYLNPLVQNHRGFGGIDFIEETNVVSSTYVSADDVGENGGHTDSYRQIGSNYLHCAARTEGIDFEDTPPPSFYPEVAQPVNGSNSQSREGNDYYDYSNSDRVWIDESQINNLCDINENGVTDFVRLKDAVAFECPCGPGGGSTQHVTMNRDYSTSWSTRGFRFRINQLNCDGDQNDADDRPDALRTETGNTHTGIPACGTPLNHRIMRPAVGGVSGITEAQSIDATKEVLILSQAKTNPPNGTDTSKSVRFISGIGDDDADMSTGFGRWAYLGGHRPGGTGYSSNGSSPTNGTLGLEGMRLYLNNILFGSTQGIQPGGAFTPSTGAVNPGALTLGSGAGQFGAAGGGTANGYQSIFMVGSNGIGLPVGAQFATAPGNFSAQTDSSNDFLFTDGGGTSTSDTWATFASLPAAQKATHPQVVSIAIVERIPLGTAITPTPEANLSDYFPPATNAARDKSIYGGDPAFDPDDPVQARDVHVVGFAEYFLIDPANQSPSTTDSSVSAHFVTTTWREGEVRGYFLRNIIAPAAAVVYPASPAADPR